MVSHTTSMMVDQSLKHAIKTAYADQLVELIVQLIEEKHLYQSIRLDVNATSDAITSRLTSGTDTLTPEQVEGVRAVVKEGVLELTNTWWTARSPKESRVDINAPADVYHSLAFEVVSVRSRCGTCGEVGPLNLVICTEAASGLAEHNGNHISDENVFTFSFLCQSCRRGLEVFMVSRKAEKLTLVGRSPMEQVDVPKVIPKRQRKYFSGAVIAFNAGQTLAALFMLRTMIEQWTRMEMGAEADTLKADAVLDLYTSSLLDAIKEGFPSLREAYGKLSSAIHRAEEDAKLFQEVRRDVTLHFEARELFDRAARSLRGT